MMTPKKANKFTFFLLLYMALLPFALFFVINLLGYDQTPKWFEQAITLFQDFIAFVIPVCIFLFFSKQKITDLVPHEKIDFKNVIYIVGLAILVMPLMNILGAIASIFVSTSVSDVIINDINELSFPLGLISLAVLPAICEEVVFRGIVMTGYKKVSPFVAILISSLFFGFMHQNLYQFSYAALTGVFLGFLVYFTNSIYASILAHFIINGSQVIATKLALMDNSQAIMESLKQPLSKTDILAQLVGSFFFAILTLPFFILVFYKFAKRNKANSARYVLGSSSTELYVELDTSEKKTKIIDIYFVGTIIVTIILFIATSFLA